MGDLRPTGADMDSDLRAILRPAEHAVVTAVADRVRHLRRLAGIPDGMPLAEAIALGMLRPEEVARARWGTDPDETLGRPDPGRIPSRSCGGQEQVGEHPSRQRMAHTGRPPRRSRSRRPVSPLD